MISFNVLRLPASLLAVLCACLLSHGVRAADVGDLVKQPSFSFAIVPQQVPSKLLQAWGPLLKQLEHDTGYRFVFRTAPDIPTFEARVAGGEYDFAYMNPYHFTVFNQGDEGFQAIARARDSHIQGILVVRKDSPVTALGELRGATLAFPAPAAFAASVLPRAHLRAAHIPFETKYVASHDSVYKAVANGFVPAGGGVIRTLQTTDPKVRDQLRVLWTSPSYTPHAIAAHPRVPVDVRLRVQQALILMNETDQGRAALAKLKLNGFQAAKNADWDDVRALGIDKDLGKAE